MTDVVGLDHDGFWKEVVGEYLPDLVRLWFPEADAQFDWERGYQPLNQELLHVDPTEPADHRRADAVFQVWLRDGTETWLIVHLEVQTRLSRELPHRLFEYYTRLTALRNREVVTLVLLTGSPRSRPTTLRFRRARLGCVCTLEVPVLHLARLADRERELAASANQFGRVALAHLAALATARDPAARLAAKARLTLSLYEFGYSAEQAQRLFAFFDWLLRLPGPLDEQFIAEIRRYEETQTMPVMGSSMLLLREQGRAEGLELGREEGREEGRRGSIADILRIRFPAAAEAVIAELNQVSNLAALERLVSLAVQAANLDEVRAAIQAAQALNGAAAPPQRPSSRAT